MTLFSKIIAGEMPSYKIAENDLFFAFLDIAPVKKGHTLVVPKIEVDKLFDLPGNYLAGLLPFAQPIAQSIEKHFNCNRVSIITVGLEVPHAHVHLIPMNGTEDMDITAKKLRLSPDEFEAIRRTIVSGL